MFIIYKGKFIGTEKEKNIETTDEFGFHVVVFFKPGKYGTGPRSNEGMVLRNVTQVHYLYKFSDGPSIAFESDLIGTGRTNKVADLEGCIITNDTELVKFDDQSTHIKVKNVGFTYKEVK